MYSGTHQRARLTCGQITCVDASRGPAYNADYQEFCIQRSKPTHREPHEATMAMPTDVTDIREIEDRTFNESDSVEVPPPDIVAYNELRSCADLFRMFREGILEVRPDFQRQIVWNTFAQTRFIDSLVKQLPIPSMCFSLDYRTQKWQVIDGLQRMWSIIRFLRGDDWRLARLEDIDQSLSGQHVPDFFQGKSNLSKYYTRIENLSIPITVIRCDYSKVNHMEYLFTIFHRLNSGGAKLNNQEIRNCIFYGTFNELLRELDQDERWLAINGRTLVKQDRYRGQEQILRFFAFNDKYDAYRGRLTSFLNRYMKENRKPRQEFLSNKRNIFRRTIDLVSDSIYGDEPRDRRSISLLEATLVGVSLSLDYLESLSARQIRQMYDEMLVSEEFSDLRLSEGLSSTRRTLERMSAAKRAFSGPGNG